MSTLPQQRGWSRACWTNADWGRIVFAIDEAIALSGLTLTATGNSNIFRREWCGCRGGLQPA